ncbi:hypothetical protein ACFL02_05050 [Planctomycetota bacterium]
MKEIDEKEILKRFAAISEFNMPPEVVGRDLKHVRVVITDQVNKLNNRPHNIWRTIMKSKLTKYAAAAVIIIAMIIGISQLGTPFDANQAFADAINSVQNARTFSCILLDKFIMQDGGEGVIEQLHMFKEPDLERFEERAYRAGELKYEYVTITDYGARQQLRLKVNDMTARLYDRSEDFTVSVVTGQPKLRQLNTDICERLLKYSNEAMEDLGIVELEGQTVRKLQALEGIWITTVWIDPETNLPVQIQYKPQEGPDHGGIYKSIQIDTELDDDLFSTDLPDGYTLEYEGPYYENNKQKLVMKIMSLLSELVHYSYEHQGQFPEELTDLVTAGFMTAEELKLTLAPPDHPDAPPAIRYRPPRLEADQNEVVLYEIYDQWPSDGLSVGFENSSATIFGPDDQQRFEEMIK